MAEQSWHSNVPDEAYLGFDRELKEGVWGSIDITAYDSPDYKLDDPFVVPWEIRLKLRLSQGRTRLAKSLGHGDSVLDALDDNWDGGQKRLHFSLAFHEAGKDPDKREAALYLRPLMTRGNGLEQTNYTYWKEAEFGDMQLAFLDEEKHPKVVAAVKRLVLEPVFDTIRATTNALSKGIGRTPGSKEPELPPYKRLKIARIACRDAFSSVYYDLKEALESTRPGPAYDRLKALLAPLALLLEKNPITKETGEKKPKGEKKETKTEEKPKEGEEKKPEESTTPPSEPKSE